MRLELKGQMSKEVFKFVCLFFFLFWRIIPGYGAARSERLQLWRTRDQGSCRGSRTLHPQPPSDSCSSRTRSLVKIIEITFDPERRQNGSRIATHRRHERRRSSADRELRPTRTQRLSASRDKQAEVESTQNLVKLESHSSGSSGSSSLWVVTAFTRAPRNGGSGPTCRVILHAVGRISWLLLWEEPTCVSHLT